MYIAYTATRSWSSSPALSKTRHLSHCCLLTSNAWPRPGVQTSTILHKHITPQSNISKEYKPVCSAGGAINLVAMSYEFPFSIQNALSQGNSSMCRTWHIWASHAMPCHACGCSVAYRLLSRFFIRGSIHYPNTTELKVIQWPLSDR